MLSFLPSGTFAGGRRSASRASPRRISKSSFDAPPVMKRTVSGSPRPGRSRASIQRARRSGSTRFPCGDSVTFITTPRCCSKVTDFTFDPGRELRPRLGDALGEEVARPEALVRAILLQHLLRDGDLVNLG